MFDVCCVLFIAKCFVCRLMIDACCAYVCDVVRRLFFNVLLFGVCCWWLVVRCSVFLVNC